MEWSVVGRKYGTKCVIENIQKRKMGGPYFIIDLVHTRRVWNEN